MSRWQRTLAKTHESAREERALDHIPDRCSWCGSLRGSHGYLCGRDDAAGRSCTPLTRAALKAFDRC